MLTRDARTVIEMGGHGNDLGDTSASPEAMKEHRLPIAYRDECAGLLIPLNDCRKKTYGLPWKCEDERHSYEKCEYLEYKKRMAELKQNKKH
jgi:NADH dehydrogenase (ubiquinone) 1 beta subcomplex subunit 7